MRRLLPVVLAVAASTPVVAQDAPRAELFGGYSFARSDAKNRHGWNAALAFNLTKRWALVADASGQYGSSSGLSGSQTTLSGGPCFSLGRTGGVNPFVHALFGRVRTSASLRVLGVTISETDSGFGMLFGGGIDLKARDNIAIRLVQADYVLTRREGVMDNGIRLSAGVVFRMGRR